MTVSLKMNPKSRISKPKFLKHLTPQPVFGFWIAIASIFLLAAILRFWGINQFNTLVFDEVYYAKYALNYLDGVPLFDAHPPLGKYMIALGILIGSHLPFGTGTPNGFTGILLSPFSYRWLNAFVGSLLPLVVAGLAYQLSHRRSYALIAGLLTATDGLLLVESRYALINLYLVFFGFLGHWLFLRALDSRGKGRSIWLIFAGICLGASVAVKWNGLGFLLGIYLVWFAAWLPTILNLAIDVLDLDYPNFQAKLSKLKWVRVGKNQTPLQNLKRLPFWQMLLYLGIIPLVVYCLVWIPHLQINTDFGFWGVHKAILSFHKGMPSGKDVHPYCSAWYTWPFMLRPMVYLFEKARNTTELVPTYPPLPEGAGKVIYDIHAMGNPGLWWLSISAILLLFLLLAHQVWVWLTDGKIAASRQPGNYSVNGSRWAAPTLWTPFYLVINYAANWLPWMGVTRCTFIYLYMSASVFSFLALAWVVDRWLRSYQKLHRILGVTAIFAILIALVFWLPVYWGLPISQADFNHRMWFRSWI
jgi:dolichyl-phosphate-mannose--protein O-mannosyl transferase